MDNISLIYLYIVLVTKDPLEHAMENVDLRRSRQIFVNWIYDKSLEELPVDLAYMRIQRHEAELYVKCDI